MELARLLHTQGFGTRRECTALVRAGQVEVDARVVDDPEANVEPAGRVLCVRGEPWPVHLPAIVMLHKPAGYECSAAPSAHPSVLSLLPPPLRTRGVQPVGRLDADTTGLLLLTDDGALAHRLIHPRRHVPKVYEVVVKHALAPDTVARLLAGVVLRDDPAPVRALACEATGERSLRLTLGEGRYHQVKRMLAAVGNRVESLHRSGFGALHLPAELAPGQWRWIERAEDVTG
jgi:16S rRNA pseudouridine516 synthase